MLVVLGAQVMAENEFKVEAYDCSQNMYYCGMFSYSKPILSAEQEQTLVITAQSCTEMARICQFVRTYIMEFSAGFQPT